MQNAMRERLIEILNVPIYPKEGVDPAEVVADYLLDNGVIVPLLKIGDKVWYATACDDEITIEECTVTEVGVRGFWMSGFVPAANDMSLFTPWHELGREVFLSIEKAKEGIKKAAEKLALLNSTHQGVPGWEQGQYNRKDRKCQ